MEAVEAVEAVVAVKGIGSSEVEDGCEGVVSLLTMVISILLK